MTDSSLSNAEGILDTQSGSAVFQELLLRHSMLPGKQLTSAKEIRTLPG